MVKLCYYQLEFLIRISRKRLNMEKYKVFLGSEIAKTYDEAKNFTLARVEEYVKFNYKELFQR